jgi:hypothetical protein
MDTAVLPKEHEQKHPRFATPGKPEENAPMQTVLCTLHGECHLKAELELGRTTIQSGGCCPLCVVADREQLNPVLPDHTAALEYHRVVQLCCDYIYMATTRTRIPPLLSHIPICLEAIKAG